MIDICKAKPTHIPGIAAVVHDVWDQDILPDVCQEQIDCNACALWVALEEYEVAGFVSTFLTIGERGSRRWEVDLLAVRRVSQGQRLGQKLVEAACRIAQEKKANIARAAIRVDNIASQRTFENAGFTTNREVHRLLVWPPDGSGGSIIYGGSVRFVAVNTVTYRGLWLEGLTAYNVDEEEQRNAVRMARSIITWEGRDNTGAMIPAIGSHRLAPDLREAAEMHGEYHWFCKTLHGGK
jgi:ribosomal protein S18 acetylase RimI-like enzyme